MWESVVCVGVVEEVVVEGVGGVSMVDCCCWCWVVVNVGWLLTLVGSGGVGS